MLARGPCPSDDPSRTCARTCSTRAARNSRSACRATLALAGDGVALGYLNRPELTTKRFVTLPSLGRVYRTGDRVRRLATGALEFLGRVDDQVKVRGFRVELGEIEQVLRANPGVADVVVLLAASEEGEAHLAAFVVPAAAGYAVSHSDRPTSATLTNWLASQLPAYMVPSAIVLLDAMPLTPNGKLDRRALAALPLPGTAAVGPVEPRTETERQLVVIWKDVLKRDAIGVTDGFLELGGHSLLAIRVLGRISKQFGVRLALRTLFEAPTIERLGAVVDTERVNTAPSANQGIVATSRDAFRIGKTPPAGPEGTGGAR